MKHPLLNPDSTHYDNDGEMPDIHTLESIMTISALISWCTGNIYKYQMRLNKKGQAESDMVKIATFNAYKLFLTGLPEHNSIARDVIDRVRPDMEYFL